MTDLLIVNFCQVVHYTGREYPGTTQLASARVLASLYRLGGAREVEGVVTFRVLPCLVRYVEAESIFQPFSRIRSCKKEETAEMRVLAADTLAYLIEVYNIYYNIDSIWLHTLKLVQAFLFRVSSSCLCRYLQISSEWRQYRIT